MSSEVLQRALLFKGSTSFTYTCHLSECKKCRIISHAIVFIFIFIFSFLRRHASPTADSRVDHDLLSNANDTTSRTCTSVASLLALIIATLSEIISAGVHNDSAADDALWADQLDELVGLLALCIALAVRLEIAKISDVAVAVLWCTVLLVLWVDYSMKSALYAVSS